MTSYAREVAFGANVVGRDRTRFRFWAPRQETVSVDIDGTGAVLMTREEGGWFVAEAGCGHGARYRYRLGDGMTVPDPASRAQPEDVHGPSMVVDPRLYRWRHAGWRGRPWREAVIYELHVGLCGGFTGVQQMLPRLVALGVTAVELMPINDFPGQRNWGYDGVLPFAPDASYGSPDDLKALIDAAHGHGLMVFLDVVYNHFGPDGNYIAHYAPQMFRDDRPTPWGAVIDFRRPEVRRFFTENALYWLMEYRFDGLRFDAVHAITEPDWLDEMAAEIRTTVETARHVHLVLEHDGNVAEHLRRDFDAQWNDDGHHVLHVLLTGEREGYYVDYAEDAARRLARCLAEGFVYQGEASRHRGGKARGTRSKDLPPTAFVLFLQNHDQIGNRALGERLTALAEPRALEAAIALQLLCPQVPLLFMGEEDASTTPFFFFTDHHGELADAVREGRRREFAHFAAFSDAERRAGIPDPNAVETFARSRPQPDPAQGAARHAFYQRLLSLRRTEIVPRLDGARTVEARSLGPAAVVATWTMGDGAALTIATNLSRTSVRFEAPAGALLFAVPDRAGIGARAGRVAGYATVVFLEKPP